jgi:hypothetical protein
MFDEVTCNWEGVILEVKIELAGDYFQSVPKGAWNLNSKIRATLLHEYRIYISKISHS